MPYPHRVIYIYKLLHRLGFWLDNAATGYDRDGLRAVAHLGGVGGIKKYVRTKGEYNPADELGTSLQSYYDKFSTS